MVIWKALLKDKTMICDNFTKNRKNIEKVYITMRAYIYEDPEDNSKEISLRKFARKYNTVPIKFKRVENTDYIYDVTNVDNLLIQTAMMRDARTGAEGIVGIKLTMDKKIIYFDDTTGEIKGE